MEARKSGLYNDEEKGIIQKQMDELVEEIKVIDMTLSLKENRKTWADEYRKCAQKLRKIYMEAVQNEMLEMLYVFNRRIGTYAKEIHEYAQKQEYDYLYEMGALTGIIQAFTAITPCRNREQIFYIQMAEIIGRAHVKKVLKHLYEHDYEQNKNICESVSISASQLKRITDDLVEIGCIERYGKSKYVYYSLTALGKRYVKEILGYKKRESIEVDIIPVGQKKTILDENKKNKGIEQAISKYAIDSEWVKRKYSMENVWKGEIWKE